MSTSVATTWNTVGLKIDERVRPDHLPQRLQLGGATRAIG
jgi:hypothetical protein